MTTDHDLLAKIDALTPEQRLKALRAVVERKEIEIIPTDSNYMGHYQVGYKKGYNQCLADIKADIKKELK